MISNNPVTPTRTSTKRFSLASSASQPRPSVHFDNEALVSHPQTINSSLKRRLSSVASSHALHKSSPVECHYDNDHTSSRRRQSIVLTPTKFSFPASRPNIDPTTSDDSPRRRRRSIVLPPLTTSVPEQTNPIVPSPRKRRFSAISPPLHDPIHDSDGSTSRKRRFSVISSSSPRTQKLFLMPPSVNKPPPQVCAEVNQRIRSTFHYPDFDFMQHVQHRSYVVRTQYFRESVECVTMLDTGVDGLLQRSFEKLVPQVETTMNIDIRASPGKGLGMFSRKEILSGESFLVEYPTAITPYVIGLSIGLSQLYADIFGRLSDLAFREIMDLSCSALISGETNDVHEAIMRINALAIELPVPDGQFPELNTHRAIFLQTSRCNHSCVPNSRWEWDIKRFSLVLTAVRPIKEGEEITISYVTPNMSRKERQDILSNFYGFECLCPFCTEDDLVRSSTRIKANSQTTLTSTSFSSASLPSFETWCLDPTFPDDILIKKHLHALQLIEREGLQILDTSLTGGSANHPARNIGRHLDAIAMCYGALEDVDSFRTWIKRVSEARLRNDDKREKQKLERVFKKWFDNPSSFPVWGWRRVFQVCGEGDGKAGGEFGLLACVNMGMFEFI